MTSIGVFHPSITHQEEINNSLLLIILNGRRIIENRKITTLDSKWVFIFGVLCETFTHDDIRI